MELTQQLRPVGFCYAYFTDYYDFLNWCTACSYISQFTVSLIKLCRLELVSKQILAPNLHALILARLKTPNELLFYIYTDTSKNRIQIVGGSNKNLGGGSNKKLDVVWFHTGTKVTLLRALLICECNCAYLNATWFWRLSILTSICSFLFRLKFSGRAKSIAVAV